MRFLARELRGRCWTRPASELARFVGADPEDLAFVPNATTGVNTVLRVAFRSHRATRCW